MHSECSPLHRRDVWPGCASLLTDFSRCCKNRRSAGMQSESFSASATWAQVFGDGRLITASLEGLTHRRDLPKTANDAYGFKRRQKGSAWPLKMGRRSAIKL